jgi:hypothetical protein
MVLSYLTSMLTCHNYLFDHHHHHRQNSPFRAIGFLIRFCQIYSFLGITLSGFHFLDFAVIIFYRARSSGLRPTPNLKDQVSVFMVHSDKVAQLYPLAPGCVFVVFYDSQGYGGEILTYVHAGNPIWSLPNNCVIFVLFYLLLQCNL